MHGSAFVADADTSSTSGGAARRVPKGLRARTVRFDDTIPGPAIRLPPRPFAAARTAVAVPHAGRVVLAAVVAFWFLLVIATLPLQLVQDSWLALVSGREVAQHGLPHHDTLTLWTLGRRWIDQQWLGQLFYYGLARLGGIRAVLLVHALMLVSTLAVGLRAARSLGASVQSVALGGVSALTVAPWMMQMRTQDLGELAFVAVLWLLALDAQRQSRRVYLVVPLLFLWANLHGSVVLGAGFVALRAVFLLRRHLPRAFVLFGAAAVSPLVSPYGFSLVGYYHQLLANPVLHSFINEWGPSTPSPATAAFYALALATVWLLGRHGKRITGFERLALLFTMFGAATAIRSIVWFGLTALVLLPRLVDPLMGDLDFGRFGRFARPLAAGTIACVVGTAAYAATRPTGWYLDQWPVTQSERIATLAGESGSRSIFADDRYADWLLWTQPQLRGRIAYDVRFELFKPNQLRRLAYYRNRIGDTWRGAASGYALDVFDPTLQRNVEAGLLAEHRFRAVVRTPQIVVLASANR
jgi:hypothetical protein